MTAPEWEFEMPEAWSPDKATADLNQNQGATGRPQLTVQSKFLDAIRRKAETEYLQLIVHYETPNRGYCYIQEKDSFVTLYSFHFDFGKTSAEIYTGTDNVTATPAENRRIVELSDGAKMEEVLKEIIGGVDEAAKVAHPQIKAFSAGESPASLDKAPTAPDTFAPTAQPSDDVDSLFQRSGARSKQKEAEVWAETETTAKLKVKTTYHQQSHRVRNAAAVVLIVILFLLFVPVFAQEAPTTNCLPGVQCTAAPSYHASFTAKYYGIGGVLLDAGQGWNSSTFVGSSTMPWGGTAETIGFWYYRFYG